MPRSPSIKKGDSKLHDRNLGENIAYNSYRGVNERSGAIVCQHPERQLEEKASGELALVWHLLESFLHFEDQRHDVSFGMPRLQTEQRRLLSNWVRKENH